MNKVILASASPRRRELLTQIGMEYERQGAVWAVPGIAETAKGSRCPLKL